jgi:phenylalanyl-tRNA synthetase beta chain
VLGFAPEESTVAAILTRLGMRVQVGDGEWLVSAPPCRADIAIEADLIEEVVRINGYERIPARMPSGSIYLKNVAEGGMPRIPRAREVLVQRGYQEAVTYSFVAAKLDAAVGGGSAAAIALANPISADMAVMRTSLWSGLLQAFSYNLSRQQTRIRLFETGRSFERKGDEVRQINKLSGICCGTSWPEQWGSKSHPADFFDLKGDVTALLDVLVPRASWDERAATHAALHPGQSADIHLDGRSVALLGALHPDLHKEFGPKTPVYLFEIDLDALPPSTVPRFAPVSRFPLVRRDLSLTLAREIPAAAILRAVWASAPSHLRDLQLFDVYEGEGIDSGKKSVALGLIFQGVSSTLIDEDIDAQVGVIVKELVTRLGAVLRDS